MDRRLAGVFVPLGLLLLATSAHAVHLLVPGDYPTIADGLAAASPGDTVEVACGTYFEHDLDLPAGVTLLSEGADPSCVTIDAQRLGRVFQIRFVTGVVVDGFTFTGGLAAVGGGLSAAYAQYVIRRCRFTGNECTGAASAIADSHGEVRLEFCLIDSNQAGGDPLNTGSVIFGTSNATLRNCTVTNNSGNYIPMRAMSGTVFMDHIIHRGIMQQQGVVITESCNFRVEDDPRFCDPANGDFRLKSTSPCLPGGVCADLIGALPSCGLGGPVTVNISATDPAIPFAVDGVTVNGPVTYDWDPLSIHVLVAPDSLATPDTRFHFREWSDDPAAPRERLYVAPTTGTGIVAEYDRHFPVTLRADKHGSVNEVAPWHPEGSTVVIGADSDPGFRFNRWSGSGPGSYSGNDPVAQVTVGGPIEEVASFQPLRYGFTVSASDTDPWETSAAPTNGPRFLHLWLVCANGGVAALEMFTSGTLVPSAFVPADGVLNVGTSQHLLLAIPNCPTGDPPLRLGSWFVLDPGGRLCPNMFRPNAGEDGGAVDCHPSHAVRDPGARITGFASDGRPPCTGGTPGCGEEVPAGELPGTSTPGRTGTGATVRLSVDPNPFRGSTRLALQLPYRTEASLLVFDVAGRRVRKLLDRRVSEGTTERFVWDGRDDLDRPLPAGVYFIRLESPAGAATRKVTHLGHE